MHAVAITPAGLMELVRSYCPISGGHPDNTAGWLLRWEYKERCVWFCWEVKSFFYFTS
jgi:hypothetical protein